MTLRGFLIIKHIGRGARMEIKLQKIRIQNFRGYHDEWILFDSNINVIIGRNDVGKSTILEALEIFFNNEQVKIDVGDRNIATAPDEKVKITCCFRLADSAVTIIDSTVSIRLDDEFLLNSENMLEIRKEWDCSKSTISTKDIKTFIIANYPNIEQLNTPLVCEKITSLKKIGKEVCDQELYAATNQAVSSELRKAIYTALNASDADKKEKAIEVAQEDAKNIWVSLSKSLPLFFLFKSDRVNTDKDSEVQSPMKAITKTALSDLQAELDAIVSKVKSRVEEIGKETIERLSELNEDIAKSLTPRVNTKAFDSIFSFDLESDDGIPLNKKGSGVRRLILLSYFRAEAHKKLQAHHNNSIIYAIEEPETSQHPNFQKMIMETLIDLSKDGMHQILVTTHTPEIAKMVELEQLIFIQKDELGIPKFHARDGATYHDIATTLGVLPFAVEKVVICVEGENDVNFISNISKIVEFKNIVDLDASRIKIMSLNGSNLQSWVDGNYFAESNVKEIHIYDRDVESYRKKAEDINQSNDKRRFAQITQYLEMENYIPPKLIEDEFGIDLTDYYENWSEVDIPQLLLGMVKQEIREPKKREMIIKRILNSKLSKQITTEMLKNLGSFEEWESFFKKIAAIMNGTYVHKIISQ